MADEHTTRLTLAGMSDRDLLLMIISKQGSLQSEHEKVHDMVVELKEQIDRLDKSVALATRQVKPLGTKVAGLEERIVALEDWQRESAFPPGSGI